MVPYLEAEKRFIKIFQSLCYKQSSFQVFNDFLDFALLMLRLDKKAEDFKELESRWTDKADYEKFAEMLCCFADAADYDGNGFYDMFGDIFMEFFSNERKGQFFTPQSLCDMMALLTYGEELQEANSVCDPCCGSGRTLLAMGKLNRKLKFYAADIDLTCCKMTVLNMLINSMSGEVAWMDTLSMEHCQSWHIFNTLDLSGHFIPQYYVTGKGETNMVQQLKNSMAKQPKSEIYFDTSPQETMQQIMLF